MSDQSRDFLRGPLPTDKLILRMCFGRSRRDDFSTWGNRSGFQVQHHGFATNVDPHLFMTLLRPDEQCGRSSPLEKRFCLSDVGGLKKSQEVLKKVDQDLFRQFGSYAIDGQELPHR
jgi:hypothetical protein